MATASASAASGVDAVEAGNSILTIIATCRFSACPTPTTVFLMRLAAYSATGRPVKANVASATPRACPSFSADCGSRLMNVSSTAASCGPSRSMSPVSKRWIAARRSASEAAASVSIEPQPTKLSRDPAASITPQPVARRPGSTPRMRIAPRLMRRLIYEFTRERILPAALVAFVVGGGGFGGVIPRTMIRAHDAKGSEARAQTGRPTATAIRALQSPSIAKAVDSELS